MNKSAEHRVVVIAGPSGVGKSSIIDGILKKCKNFAFLVSATTRPKRPGEQDKINYYFLSDDEFKKYLDEGLIPEYRFVEKTGYYYGTFLPDLHEKIEKGKIVIADLDIIGARYMKEHYNSLNIFIMPPDKDTLISRIKKRADGMSKEELQERLDIARREMTEDIKFYDHVVVNEEGRLDETINTVLDIIKQEGISCKN